MRRGLKNVLAAFLVLAMLLSVEVVPASAKTFTDVGNTYDYYEEVSSLVALELLAGYEDGSFKPNATITRAEFSAVIARALGMSTFVTPTDLSSVFSDMTNEDGSYHWSSGFVSFAYKKEIILGMGDGTFCPDNPITYEQAVKMIVCTLGYGDSAEDNGGWPNGYIQKGDELGITKDAIVSPTNLPASRGMVAKLVYNALEVNIAEKNSSGYYQETTKTLLNDKLKVKKFKNMMITEVDGETTINSAKAGLNKGEVLLESGTDSMIVSYNNVTTSSDLKSKLGYYISGYYRVGEDDEKILISLDESSSKNVEVVINSDDIDLYSNFELEYWVDKDKTQKTKKITLSDEAKLIYNGMVYAYDKSSDAKERDLSKWLDPASSDFVYGSVRLLDSDGDSEYDAVFMNDYEVYVVKSAVVTTDTIPANNYVVYDYYNTSRNVTLDVMDEVVNITIKNSKTNADVKVESLKAMNVLSVAKSIDESMYTCFVSTQTVSGEITSMSEKNHLYTINGVEYKLTKEFEALVEAGKENLALGTNGTYYLDNFGRIAAVKATAAQAGNYGYITIAAPTGTTGDVATVKLVPLSSSSTVTKLDLSSKVKINGKLCTSADSALEALRGSASLIKANSDADVSNGTYSQLVRYVKNSSSGDITSISTVTAVNGEIAIGQNTDKSKVQMGKECTKLMYNGSGKFSDAIFINSSTKVLIVPDNRLDEEKYKYSSGYSMFISSSSYEVEAYDVNSSGVATVIIVYGADTSRPISSDTKLCIIKEISTMSSTITDDICYNIEVYEEGVLKNYETEDLSDKYTQLHSGDIVRFGYNSDGQINTFKKALDSQNLAVGSSHDSTMYNGDYKFKTIFGTVLNKSDELIMIVPQKVEYHEAPVEDEGETPAEDEGKTPSEDEGETPAGGEDETPAESEDETLTEEEGTESVENSENMELTEEAAAISEEDSTTESTVIEGYSLSETGKEGYTKASITKIYRVIMKANDVVIEAAPWDSIIAYSDVENDTASMAFAHAYNNNLKLVVVYVESK